MIILSFHRFFSPRQFQPLSAIEFFSNRPLEVLEGHLFVGSHHGWVCTTVERLPTTSLPLSVLSISTRLGQPSVAQLITAKPPFGAHGTKQGFEPSVGHGKVTLQQG